MAVATAGQRVVREEARPGAGRIDRDKGVIYGCQVLGENSRNTGRDANTYPRETREKAIPLFEGCSVFVDHPDVKDQGKTRSYKDKLGVLRNVRESGRGLVADFHVNKHHPLADSVFYDAETAPHSLGLSINALAGRSRREGDRWIVEELARVNSVDLVSKAATTSGLLEGQRSGSRFDHLLLRSPVHADGILRKALSACATEREAKALILEAERSYVGPYRKRSLLESSDQAADPRDADRARRLRVHRLRHGG